MDWDESSRMVGVRHQGDGGPELDSAHCSVFVLYLVQVDDEGFLCPSSIKEG